MKCVNTETYNALMLCLADVIEQLEDYEVWANQNDLEIAESRTRHINRTLQTLISELNRKQR